MTTTKQTFRESLTGRHDAWGGGGLPLVDGFSGTRMPVDKSIKKPPHVLRGRDSFAFTKTGGSIFPPNKQAILDGYVADLLATRPNYRQMETARQAFDKCEMKRRKIWCKALLLFSGGVASLTFAPVLILGNIVGVFLCFLVFFSSMIGTHGLLTTPPSSKDNFDFSLDLGRYNRFWQRAFRKHAIPLLPGFEHARNLRAAEHVNLEGEDIHRLTTSPDVCAYLRGVATQEVPLLRMDADILEQLFDRDRQRETLSRLRVGMPGEHKTSADTDSAGIERRSS